jgi:hypothetical protein
MWGVRRGKSLRAYFNGMVPIFPSFTLPSTQKPQRHWRLLVGLRNFDMKRRRRGRITYGKAERRSKSRHLPGKIIDDFSDIDVGAARR